MYTWDIVPVLALETMAVPMYHILGWCSPNRGCVEACSHFQGRVPHQSRVVHSAHSCYQRTYPSKTQTYTYHVTSHTGYHTTDDTTYHNTLCTICFKLAKQVLRFFFLFSSGFVYVFSFLFFSSSVLFLHIELQPVSAFVGFTQSIINKAGPFLEKIIGAAKTVAYRERCPSVRELSIGAQSFT